MAGAGWAHFAFAPPHGYLCGETTMPVTGEWEPPMLALIRDRQKQIAALCKRHRLRRLDVFGSAAREADFDPETSDLDIRGAGNLSGEEQSGHIREAGFELYQSMLDEAVAALKGGGAAEIADQWAPEIAAFAEELEDRFGALPGEVRHLLEIVAIKALCRRAGVAAVDAGPRGAVLTFRPDAIADGRALVRFVQTEAERVRLQPDHRLVYKAGWTDAARRVAGVRALLTRLAEMAEAGQSAA